MTPEEKAANDAAVAYVEAHRHRLQPKVRVSCGNRGHMVAAVYSTRWGNALWSDAFKIAPAGRRRAVEISVETGVSRRDAEMQFASTTRYTAVGGNGLLDLIVEETSNPGFLCRCRCSMYEVDYTWLFEALESGERIVQLAAKQVADS